MGGAGIPDKGTLLAGVKPDAGGAQAAVTVPEAEVIRPFLISNSGVVVDPVVNAYTAEVVNRLLAGWPGVRPPLAFYVVPISDVTAEATANGGLMVTTGALTYLTQNAPMRTEDHFAFFVAHELSHILLGHTRDKEATQLWMHRASGAISLGFALLPKVINPALGGELGRLGLDRAAAGQLGAMAAAGLADNVVLPSWSRSQERAADALAIDLMAKAGYLLDAVPEVLDVIVLAEARDAELSDRRRAEAAQRSREAADAEAARKGQTVLFHAGGIDGEGKVQALIGGLTSGHPPAIERVADARAYINREYSDQLVHEHRVEFERFISRREVKALLADAKLLSNAIEASANQPKAALATLRSLGRSSIATSSYARYTLAMVQENAGPVTTVSPATRDAASGPYATLPAELLLAQRLEATNQLVDALSVYEKAQAQFDDPTPYPSRIRILKKLGRTTDLSLVRARCVANGDPAIRLLCDDAAK